MHLIGADAWRLGEGRVTVWKARGRPLPLTHARLPSLDQRNHVEGHERSGSSVWMAAVVEVDHHLPAAEAHETLLAALRRHPALRTECVHTTSGLRSRLIPAEAVRLEPVLAGAAPQERPDAAELVIPALDRACRPGQLLSVAAGLVQRDHSATVLLAFDHQHGDAYSVDLLVEQIAAELDGDARAGRARSAEPDAADAPGQAADPAGSCVQPVARSESAVTAWESTMAARGHVAPSFPADLGLDAGASARQLTITTTLLDARAAQVWSAQAAQAQGTTFSALLAGAAHSLGGDLYCLTPVGQRKSGLTHESAVVGWHTRAVPLLLSQHPGGDAPQVPELRAAAQAWARSKLMAGVPVEEALASLSRPLEMPRSDLFMVSYLDYRRLPSRGVRRGTHVSASTRADDVQIWLARTDEGVQARVRLPDTAMARGAIDAFLDRWRDALRVRELFPAQPASRA